MALAVTAAVAIAVPPAQNDQHPRPPAQPEPGQPSRRLLTLAAAVGSATVLGALPAFAATPAPERPAAAPPRAPGAGHRDVVPDARLRRLDEFVVDLVSATGRCARRGSAVSAAAAPR